MTTHTVTSTMERRAFRHTHRIDVAFGDYRDSLLVTPPADVTDLEAWARGHVNAVRGPTQWVVTIMPLAQ